jgi:ubiquinone/menaquinone biosynthesis C-methylase UbiE
MEKKYNIEEQRKWNDQDMWIDSGHEWSKHFGGTDKLWNDYLFDHLKQFRNKKILEIAPGFGRWTQYLSILASELVVIDLNQNCINQTQKKMKHHVHEYFVNDGKSLSDIKSLSKDLVFSFDSFVHMHSDVIEEYIKEINRVLITNGCGFIHHSWYHGGEDQSFRNIDGRSNMTPELFKKFVESNGMTIVFQKEIKFLNVVDCLCLFVKS